MFELALCRRTVPPLLLLGCLMTGRAEAQLRVVAPAQVRAVAGSEVTIEAQLMRGSRPQPGIMLELRGARAIPGTALTGELRSVTDERGRALFRISAGTQARAYRLVVGVAGAGGPSAGVELAVSRATEARPLARAAVPSAAATRFVAGAEQRGTVHAPLAQPLVLEVRDSAGVPIAGHAVTFASSGAQLTPASATSDATGRVATSVTLGDKAGPVVVTATAGPVVRQATLTAAPDRAQQLVVEQGGTPVTWRITVQSREQVSLRVVARDGYGNDVSLSGLEVAVSGNAVRAGTRSETTGTGTIVLEPRRSGSAELVIRASGLEARVPVEATLRGGGGGRGGGSGGWLLGARLGGNAFTYDFQPAGVTGGRGGVRGEVIGGYAAPFGLRVEVGAAVGSVGGDQGSGQVSATLLQGIFRTEYAFLPKARVVPVVSFGLGAYRVKSGNEALYHTSLLWSAGLGVDVPLRPRLSGELRVERQQLYDQTSNLAAGWTGSLLAVQAGVRLTP